MPKTIALGALRCLPTRVATLPCHVLFRMVNISGQDGATRLGNVRKSGLLGIYPRQNSFAPRRKSFAFLRARPVNLSVKKAQNENLLQDPDAHSSYLLFTFNNKLSGFRPIRRQLDRTTYTTNGREKT